MDLEPQPASDTTNFTATLLIRLREGDVQAAVLLDQIYREALIRFCWGYLGRMEEAEDAVQEICYKILMADAIPDRVRPWIYKIARNHCLNLIRRRQKIHDGKAHHHVSHIHDRLTGQLTHLVNTEQQHQISEWLEKLSDVQKEVLRLRYVEDLSRTEIAEVLDIEESLVKSRLFEGLKKLKDHSEQLES